MSLPGCRILPEHETLQDPPDEEGARIVLQPEPSPRISVSRMHSRGHAIWRSWHAICASPSSHHHPWLSICSGLGGPLFAAFVLSLREGRTGLRGLFAQATRWRFSPVLYILAFGTVGAIYAATDAIFVLRGGHG